MTGQANIFTPGPHWSANSERWELVHDLFGGQRRITNNASRWRPIGIDESPREWQDLIDGASLNNGFMRTVDRVTSRVFIREVEIAGLEGNDQADLLPLLSDIDNEGTPLTQWSSDNHRTAAAYGLAHWIVEHPRPRPGADPSRIRPYTWSLDPLSVIDWVHDDDGRLLDLRIKCDKIERGENPWEFDRIDTIRRYVVTEAGVASELHARDRNSGDTRLIEDPSLLMDAKGNALADIPIVVLYFNRIAAFEARSPYEDLAYINLRHWLSYMEQAANLRTVRIPVLSATGVKRASPEDPENPGPTGHGDSIKINRRSILQDSNDKARFGYVETTGSALSEGWTDLQRLEEQMEQFGDQPMRGGRSGVETATGAYIDDLSTQGSMARWTRAQEMAITETMRLMARWRGVELPEDVKAVIREERPLQPADDKKQGRILEMYGNGLLSKTTTVAELQRAGAVSEAVDPEREVAVASGEAAEASAMLAQLDGGDGFGSEAIDQPEDEDDGERN